MNKSLHTLSRNYTRAIISAKTGRFALKSKSSPSSAGFKGMAVFSPRTVQILETRANRLRSKGAR
jgi:hypothetical protein